VPAGQRAAIVLTPALAIATLAVGMRVGARRPVHAAIVYGAPRARGATAFAWQVVTLAEDSGGRETEARSGLVVQARGRANGKVVASTWRGDTNEDGVAEVRLDLPGIERGDPIDIDVTAGESSEVLARGRATWDGAAWMDAAPAPFARGSKRVGAVSLDVAVLGGKLAARSDVPLLVRATSRDDGHPIADVAITADPEPGLDVRKPTATTCALGWARFDVSPKVYVAALGLHAKTPDGRSGEWFGGLPVATGSIHAMVPDVVRPGEGPATLRVHGQTGIYAEVDDDEGRAFGAWAKLPADGRDEAAFDVDGLAPGLKWLVTASEPRAAEIPDEATIARPFLVFRSPMPVGAPAADDACAVGAYLALHPAGGFHRSLLLDGFVARKDDSLARRKRGLAIGLGALAVGAVLEIFLLTGSALQGRRLARAALEGLDETDALVKRSSAGSVFVGLLLTLLGFALIGALLLLRS
jgi:hypothetical protein